MSNKELLQQNNSKYASLIELLRNKAINGGGSILLQEKTITPSTSSQNVTPDSGYDGLSKVTVNPIPSSYVKPTATKGAATYTPTTSNQTIASGTYLSGVQTIKGDVNLVASNIKSGVSIFGVNGSLSAGGSNNEEINDILSTLVNITISFTLDGVSYNAEEGMTWTEWLVSYYNIDGFTKDSEEPFTILTNYGSRGIIDSGQNNQSATDVITHNGEYNLVSSISSNITFTLDGVSYNAEEGMTWADWFGSDYNVDGIARLGANPLTVRTSSGIGIVVSSKGVYQSTTKVIDNNEVYTLEVGDMT